MHHVAIFAGAGPISVAALRELVAAGDPRAALFAHPDWELHDLPTGHRAMFSAPAALGDLLHEVAGQSLGDG